MTTMKQIDVNAGWDACDVNGDKIGSIKEQRDNAFVVSKGTFFPKDIYIPTNAVQRVDSNEHRVYVNVSKDDIESLGWDDPNNLTMSQSGYDQTQSTWDTTGTTGTTRTTGTTGTGFGSDTRDAETVGTMRTERTGYGDERLGGADVVDDSDDFRTR